MSCLAARFVGCKSELANGVLHVPGHLTDTTCGKGMQINLGSRFEQYKAVRAGPSAGMNGTE